MKAAIARASTKPGITLDTGALIALERGVRSLRERIAGAQKFNVCVTVPAVVLLEWWRGDMGQKAYLDRLTIEPTTERIAKLAGEAIAEHGATPIDAAVMASAALRGDVVYTSDIDDMQRLQAFFPTVRIMRA